MNTQHVGAPGRAAQSRDAGARAACSFVEPGEGYLACGWIGKGRLAEPEDDRRGRRARCCAPPTSLRGPARARHRRARRSRTSIRCASSATDRAAAWDSRWRARRARARRGRDAGRRARRRVEPPAVAELVRVRSAREMHAAVHGARRRRRRRRSWRRRSPTTRRPAARRRRRSRRADALTLDARAHAGHPGRARRAARRRPRGRCWSASPRRPAIRCRGRARKLDAQARRPHRRQRRHGAGRRLRRRHQSGHARHARRRRARCRCMSKADVAGRILDRVEPLLARRAAGARGVAMTAGATSPIICSSSRARRERRLARSRVARTRGDPAPRRAASALSRPSATSRAERRPSGAVDRPPLATLDRAPRRTSATARAASCTRSGRKQVVFGVGNPNARADVRRRGAGRRRRHPGRAVRRPRRAAADEDHRGDRPQARATSTSPTSSSAGRRATAIPSRTKSRRASRSCSGRSTRSGRRSSSRSARSRRRRCSRPTRRSRACAAACTTSAAASSSIPTFHPAFLLRSPDRKRDVWEDMKKVRALLAAAPTDRARRRRRAGARARPAELSRARPAPRRPRARACACRSARRTVTGCVVDPHATAPAGRDAPRRHRGHRRRAVPAADVVDLALWVGEYYACGPGRRAGAGDAAVGARAATHERSGPMQRRRGRGAAPATPALHGRQAACGARRCCARSRTG